jgi:hypothetical protein
MRKKRPFVPLEYGNFFGYTATVEPIAATSSPWAVLIRRWPLDMINDKKIAQTFRRSEF